MFNEMGIKGKTFFEIINPETNQLIHNFQNLQLKELLDKCLKFNFE